MQADEHDQGNEELVDCCLHTLTSFVDSFSCVEHGVSVLAPLPPAAYTGREPAWRECVVSFTLLQKEFAPDDVEFFEIFLGGPDLFNPKGIVSQSPGLRAFHEPITFKRLWVGGPYCICEPVSGGGVVRSEQLFLYIS